MSDLIGPVDLTWLRSLQGLGGTMPSLGQLEIGQRAGRILAVLERPMPTIPEIIAQLPAHDRQYFGPILERAVEAARAAKQVVK